jgi:hypothetical protein
MGIKLVPDVAAPAVVGVGDILMKKYAPTYEEWFCYGLTAVGYLVGGMNLVRGDMGDFLKNLGVASLPLTIDKIYSRVTTAVPARVAGGRMALYPVAMGGMGIRQSTTPEFADVRVS